MKPATPATPPFNPGVTEAAAAVSWCPFSRAPLNIGPGAPMIAVNRTGVEIGGVPNGATCMGQACMVWAWVEPVARKAIPSTPLGATEEPERPSGVPETWAWSVDVPELRELPAQKVGGWAEPEAEAQARRRGRCGLASQ